MEFTARVFFLARRFTANWPISPTTNFRFMNSQFWLLWFYVDFYFNVKHLGCEKKCVGWRKNQWGWHSPAKTRLFSVCGIKSDLNDARHCMRLLFLRRYRTHLTFVGSVFVRESKNLALAIRRKCVTLFHEILAFHVARGQFFNYVLNCTLALASVMPIRLSLHNQL